MYNIVRFHHIAIAVKDLNRACFMFENIFGVGFSSAEDIESQKVKVAFADFENAKIELVQATDTRSPIFPLMDHPILSFIKKNGEGLHHICFQVENLEDTISHLKTSGIRQLRNNVIYGASGKRITFLNPSDCHGLLIELTE